MFLLEGERGESFPRDKGLDLYRRGEVVIAKKKKERARFDEKTGADRSRELYSNVTAFAKSG